MGSIKQKNHQIEAKFKLTEAEFDCLLNMNHAKQEILQQCTKTLTSYMKGLTVSKWGYDMDEDLQFELDFADKERLLKVTRIPRSV